MNKKEQALFWQLCDLGNVQKERLAELLPEAATPDVLGHLLVNRMQGVAYGVLQEAGLLDRVGEQFRSTLEAAYSQNVMKNQSLTQGLIHLVDILSTYNTRYAVVEGAAQYSRYPNGHRTTDDICLLVRPADALLIGNVLLESGFQQGHMRGGLFVPVTSEEIITSRILRHRTVSYIKKMDIPFMPFLEVRICTSLEYKCGDPYLVDQLLSRTYPQEVGGRHYPVLDPLDTILYLCHRVYMGAVTLSSIQHGTDMILYQFTDLYILLRQLSYMDTDALFYRAKSIDLTAICSCVVCWVNQLFPIQNYYMMKWVACGLGGDRTILDTVMAPSENKSYRYIEKDLRTRFLNPNRLTLLCELEF